MFVRMFAMQGTGIATLVLLAQGCRFDESNPRHCNDNDGNAYCNREFGEPGGPMLYCERGTPECSTPEGRYGCVEHQPKDECYSPCGGRSTLAENGECIPIEDPPSDTTSTGATSMAPSSSEEGSTTGGPCETDEDCKDSASPFCVGGECVDCGGTKEPDAACTELDPTTPVCVEGTCVQCTDEKQDACNRMLCDLESNTCMPCVEHADCEESRACELKTGQCFPSDVVVEVDDAGLDYGSITAAVSEIPSDETHRVVIVHALNMNNSYSGSITIGGGKTVALLAAEGEAPVMQGSTGQAALVVEGGAAVYMDRMRIAGTTGGTGLWVDDALGWVDRSHVVQNTAGGIVAEQGAEVRVRNSFVGSGDDAIVLRVREATANVLYSTLGAGSANAVGLSCVDPVSVVVRNSIIVARGNAIDSDDFDCAGAVVSFSATESAVAGDGNETVGQMPTSMPTVWFANYGDGDFHLQNAGLEVFADVARRNADDPRFDIDGDLRPAMDDSPDHAGADIPVVP